jgi:quercetin dioxygenase-like cupin family protein
MHDAKTGVRIAAGDQGMNGAAKFRLLMIGLTGIFPVAGNCSEKPAQQIVENPPALGHLDPANVTITVPDRITWTGKEGEQKALLFGDPQKAGTYAMLIRWAPGHFSKPHFHSRDRKVYVISGSWWMSTSENYDPRQTVSIPAGSFVVQNAGTVHWDGALEEPCELLLIGEGPVTTSWLDQPRH